MLTLGTAAPACRNNVDPMAEVKPDFDPYATLGVGSRASASEIKRAHRALIRRLHPDVSADPSSAERAKRLNVARDWLLDPRTRDLHGVAHGITREASTNTQASRRVARDRGWERSRERGALDVFVAVCANLSDRDAHRLLAARGRVGEAGSDAMTRTVILAQERGRAAFASAAAAEAVEVVRSRLWVGPELVEILTWTAFGLGIADISPADAAILLTPWREVVDRPDPLLRAKEVVRRARRAVRTATVGLLVSIGLALAMVGLATFVRLVFGA